MKKIIVSLFLILALSSCTLLTLVDGVVSGVLDIFVYNEKNNTIYQFDKQAQEMDVKLEKEKIFVDREGRLAIHYADVPQQYRNLLVKK